MADQTQQGNGAVAVRGGVAPLIEAYRADFTNVVPAHISPDAFVQLAVSYVRANQFLRRAAVENPRSLIIALRECAALGHVPQKGIFALVPRNTYDKEQKRKVWTVVGVEEVRGVIERMYRSGAVADVRVDTMRDKDPVASWKPGRMVVPDHEYDEFADPAERGPLKAVYAVARLVTGGTVVAFLNRHQVMKYREISASGESFWGPAWPGEGPWTAKMWEKTALHRLERDVPTSSAYREAVARADAASAAGFAGLPPRQSQPELNDAQVMDAEIIDPDSADETWPEVQVPKSGGGKQ